MDTGRDLVLMEYKGEERGERERALEGKRLYIINEYSVYVM